MKRVYICGSFDTEDYELEFKKKEMMLKASEFFPVSPLSVYKHNESYYEKHKDELGRNCLKLLLTCDNVCFLDSWQDSDRAVFEAEVAKKMEIPSVSVKVLNPDWDSV